MRFVHTLHQCNAPDIQELLRGDVAVGITIGNFDGFHLGHEALFERLRHRLAVLARAQGLQPLHVLMTFYPHPRVVLGGVDKSEADSNPHYWSITPLREKARLAEERGFDLFFATKFTRSLSQLKPREFIEQYLVDALRAQLVVVGYDWSFGKGREGSVETLSREGQGAGFEVAVVPPVTQGDVRVSSSAVRKALGAGELDELERLLGRRFSILGRVEHGDKRGRELGFPTANIVPRRQLLPPSGVYAVRAYGADCGGGGVCNIGVRPTFGGEKRQVEVHLFDAPQGELYGEHIRVEFAEHLRGEKKFSGVEELRAQIEKDIAAAKTALESE